jgi:hypothetical protein
VCCYNVNLSEITREYQNHRVSPLELSAQQRAFSKHESTQKTVVSISTRFRTSNCSPGKQTSRRSVCIYVCIFSFFLYDISHKQ